MVKVGLGGSASYCVGSSHTPRDTAESQHVTWLHVIVCFMQCFCNSKNLVVSAAFVRVCALTNAILVDHYLLRKLTNKNFHHY